MSRREPLSSLLTSSLTSSEREGGREERKGGNEASMYLHLVDKLNTSNQTLYERETDGLQIDEQEQSLN